MRFPLKRSTLHLGTIILVIAEYFLHAFVLYTGYTYFSNFWVYMLTPLSTSLIILSGQMHFHWQYRSNSPEKAAFLRWFSFLFFLAAHLYPSYFVSKGFLALGYWWELTIPVVKILLALATWDSKRFLAA